MPRSGSPGRPPITIKAYKSFTANGRRTWKANVFELEKPPRNVVIEDPQHPDDYLQHDSILHDPDSDNLPPFVDDITRRQQIRTYTDKLANSLGLPRLNDELDTSDAGDATKILEIHVSDTDRTGGFSIHSLMWELLEHEQYTKHSGLSIQIVHSYHAGTYNVSGLQSSRLWRSPSMKRPFRILLVVSRSWQRTRGHFADLPPTLVSETLYHLSERLEQEGRPFTYHVIRPGTLESFRHGLEMATQSNKPYDLVHFDGHGRIAANGEPQLLFSRPYAPTAFNTDTQDGTLNFSDSYFHPVGGTKLAEILRDHRVPWVVLTSCHSAYAQAVHASNLSLVLMQHGIEEVAAINFAIRGKAANIYAEGFYTSLLVGENSLTTASAHGREYVRKHYREPLREMEHEPSALQSVYKRAGDLEQMIPEVRRPRRFPLTWFTLWQWFVIVLWASCHTIPYIKAQWDALDSTVRWIPFSVLLIRFLGRLFDIQKPYRGALAQRSTQLGTASANRWQGIGMMVVEDILRSKGSAFIEMRYPLLSAEDKSDLQCAMEEWKKTQSTDIAFVDGEQLASSLWYYNCILKRRFSALGQDLKRWAQQLWATITNTSMEEGRTNFSPTRRSIIVFTDFSYIFEPSTTPNNRDRALKRISHLRKSAPKAGRLDPLFIGTSIVPWNLGFFDPDEYSWAEGPRLHASRDLCIHETA